MKIIPNKVNEYCELIKNDLTEIYNDLIKEGYPQEKCSKLLDNIEEKITKVKKYMDSTIDVGEIIVCNVKPKDIVKIEYDNGTSCYCFEVKESRKKPTYYYCGNYIY